MGSLDPKITGNIAPYYASYDLEMIFQVPTLMPNREPSTKQVKYSLLCDIHLN
jgi:hypothetical protein